MAPASGPVSWICLERGEEEGGKNTGREASATKGRLAYHPLPHEMDHLMGSTRLSGCLAALPGPGPKSTGAWLIWEFS